jgi:phage tail-like protein
MSETEAPVSVCWGVSIDNERLGAFISCEGLGVEVVIEQREEGGNNGFIWQIPTRLKYTNIKLSRPVCPDTAGVINWLASMTTRVKPQTATISAMTADRTIVAQWSLLGVIPVRWTGPSLNADGPKVAIETIELAHHGFAPASKKALP